MMTLLTGMPDYPDSRLFMPDGINYDPYFSWPGVVTFCLSNYKIFLFQPFNAERNRAALVSNKKKSSHPLPLSALTST